MAGCKPNSGLVACPAGEPPPIAAGPSDARIMTARAAPAEDQRPTSHRRHVRAEDGGRGLLPRRSLAGISPPYDAVGGENARACAQVIDGGGVFIVKVFISSAVHTCSKLPSWRSGRCALCGQNVAGSFLIQNIWPGRKLENAVSTAAIFVEGAEPHPPAPRRRAVTRRSLLRRPASDRKCPFVRG